MLLSREQTVSVLTIHIGKERQLCEGMDANWIDYDDYLIMHTKAIIYISTINTFWQLHLNKTERKRPVQMQCQALQSMGLAWAVGVISGSG